MSKIADRLLEAAELLKQAAVDESVNKIAAMTPEPQTPAVTTDEIDDGDITLKEAMEVVDLAVEQGAVSQGDYTRVLNKLASCSRKELTMLREGLDNGFYKKAFESSDDFDGVTGTPERFIDGSPLEGFFEKWGRPYDR